MSQNLDNYIQHGKHLLDEEQKRIKREETEWIEAEQAENHTEWLSYLEPVFAEVPEDLHPYITFDDTSPPVSWASTIISRPARLTCIQYVPIKIYPRRGHIIYEVGEAHIDINDDLDERYIVYRYDITTNNVFKALSLAHDLAYDNFRTEEKLSEPEPEPRPLTTLEKARGAIFDGNPEAAQEWIMLSIAESLDIIAHR